MKPLKDISEVFFNLLRKSPFILVLLWCCKQLTKWVLLLFEKYNCICISPRNIFPRKIQGRASGILSCIYSSPVPLTWASVPLDSVFSGVPAPATPPQSSGRAAGGWAVQDRTPQPCPSVCFAWDKASRRFTWLCGSPRPCCPSISSTVSQLVVRDRKMK